MGLIFLKTKTILFDLDGTLTESGIGITRSVAYACERMGLPVPAQEVLDRFVGPPLVAAFMEYTGLSEADARWATEIYRERFSDIGWRENRVYAGIAPLLRALKARGCYLAIASGKPEVFVRRIADHFDFAKYFDAMVGIRMETTHADKHALIAEALNGRDSAGAAMVGDRKFDMAAARDMGLRAIGVAYGYGSRQELEASGADEIAESVAELREILLPGEAVTPGLFITFEGADGCGKSTQMKLLADYLSERGHDVLCTREPGGCAISECIRDLVLDIRYQGMSPECEALLYAAARAEHVRQVILPAVKCGKIVLCDRFLDSSFAYQARGRELGDDFIRQINTPARVIVPNRTLLFVGDREAVSKRLRSGNHLDRIEAEGDSFVRRVYRAYDEIHAAEPQRVHIIDSNRTIEEIFADVRADLADLIR